MVVHGLDRSLQLAKQIIKRETHMLSDGKPRCRECGRLMFHGEHDPDCETGVVQGLHYGVLSWHNAYRRMQAEAAAAKLAIATLEAEIERLDRLEESDD